MADLPRFLRTPDAPAKVRVRLEPPDGGVPLSLWAARTPAGVVLDADAPEVAPGWAVTGRGFAGTVAAVDGRTLEVSPWQ